MNTDLSDYRVVITGAAGVHGAWISEAFARRHAQLLLTDVREDKLAALSDRLRKVGGNIETVVADLTVSCGITAVGEAVAALWGSSDALVNNAGIYPRAYLRDAARTTMENVLAINLLAPFQLTQLIASQMIRAGVKGSIVNISSGAADSVQPGEGPYSVSKAALSMLNRAFALELGPYGIRVNCVAPGFAPGSEVSHLSESHVQRIQRSIPLGRTSGPNDASEAILFLCSDRATFITGTTLTVDGGRTAGTFIADES